VLIAIENGTIREGFDKHPDVDLGGDDAAARQFDASTKIPSPPGI
jgi:hypothetical protein